MSRYAPRRSWRYRAAIVRDGIVGFVAVFTVLVLLLIAAGGTT